MKQNKSFPIMYKSYTKNVDEKEAYQSFVLTQTPTKSAGRQINRKSSNDGLIH
jgi:hypothetical protein